MEVRASVGHTGKSGTFRIYFWLDGPVTVAAHHPDHGLVRRSFPTDAANPELGPIELSLEEVALLELTVVDSRDRTRVIPGVRLDWTLQGEGLSKRTGTSTTDDEGRVLLRPAAPSSLVVKVHHPTCNYRPVEDDVRLGEKRALTLGLRPDASDCSDCSKKPGLEDPR